MNTSRLFRIGLALSLALAPWSTPVWAVTTSASVTATVPSKVSITLIRDSSSVTRGSAGTVLFDKYDSDDDVSVPDRNPGFMYAPYRSETLKNWHSASILANGASLSLTATVTGTVGTTPLSAIMDVFCGGFFEPGARDPLSGTPTTPNTWELLNTFTRTLPHPFVGTVPFNYRLRMSGVAAGSYSGTITFTLTST